MKHQPRAPFTGATRLLDIAARDRIALAWRLFRDERVSGVKFAVPALLLVYLISPLDFIPDVLLGIGQTDDVGIVIGAAFLILRVIPGLAPAHVVAGHLHAMGKCEQTTEPAQPTASRVMDARFSVR